MAQAIAHNAFTVPAIICGSSLYTFANNLVLILLPNILLSDEARQTSHRQPMSTTGMKSFSPCPRQVFVGHLILKILKEPEKTQRFPELGRWYGTVLSVSSPGSTFPTKSAWMVMLCEAWMVML